MTRFPAHLSESDLAANIRFCSGRFGATPTVEKPDRAKRTFDEPRVTFAISQRCTTRGLDQLALQAGPIANETGVQRCYALSGKHRRVDLQGIARGAFRSLDMWLVSDGSAGPSPGCREPAAVGAVAMRAATARRGGAADAIPAARRCRA
jgi:hypothetical protein